MPTNKTGLQKNISAIFADVPVRPKRRSDQESDRTKGDRTRVSPPRQTSPEIQTPDVPKPQQPVQPPPKAPPDKTLKADAAKQAIGQIPRRRFERPKARGLTAPKSRLGQKGQRRNVVLVIVLSVTLIALLSRNFYTPEQNTARPMVVGSAKARLTAKPNIEIGWPVPPLYPEDIRDPMELMNVDLQTPADVEDGALKPVVRGIVHSENKPFAVIGKELMQEGEEVLGATIIKIHPDSVEFEADGERWTQVVEGQEN